MSRNGSLPSRSTSLVKRINVGVLAIKICKKELHVHALNDGKVGSNRQHISSIEKWFEGRRTVVDEGSEERSSWKEKESLMT
jgi:hypothetical protein